LSKLSSTVLIALTVALAASVAPAAPELVVASWASGGTHEGVQRYNQTTGAYLGDLSPMPAAD
jgi:hypothetical protein